MNEKQIAEMQEFQSVSLRRLDALVQELGKRARVVNEDALNHLVQRGVIPLMARDGCCKPDGGTCCPNARLRAHAGPAVQG